MDANQPTILNTTCFRCLSMKVSRLLAGALFVMWSILTSPSYAFEQLDPTEPPIPPVCIVDDSNSGGQNSSVDEDDRILLSRAEGQAFGQENSSFAQLRIGFTSILSFPAEIAASVDYSGLLVGVGGGNNRGIVNLTMSLRDFTDSDDGEVMDSFVILNREEDGDVAGTNFTPVSSVSDILAGLPTGTTFNEDLIAGRNYGIVLRLETIGSGGDGNIVAHGLSDFRNGDRSVTMSCVSIVPTWVDSDGDSLYDIWETVGIDLNGDGDADDPGELDLPGLGADPQHKDIFIEYDWTPGNEPVASSIAAVKSAFSQAPIDAGGVVNPDGDEGINLWIDTGNAATGDDLGGGQEIDLDDVPNGSSVPKFAGDFNGNGVSDFYDVKQQYFDESRRYAFHYIINSGSGVTEQGAGTGSCSDGVDNDGDGLVDGDDIANCHRNSQAEQPGNDIFLSVKGSGILMHELGHNLDLQHGGDVGTNCKPNYISVMNYNMQNGIPQDTIAGQDTDSDGMPDNRIVDYSPPRFPDGRGSAPLGQIDEEMLDEGVILDPRDPENQTVFIDGTGATQTVGVDQPLDWAGDGSPPDANNISVNVNSGPASGCSSSPLDEDPFTGHDDWSNIQMNFRLTGDFDDSANNPTEEPEPTQEDLDAVLEAIYTTDLSVTKTTEPDLVVAGQPLTIGLLVENIGPNHTQEVEVRDQLPEGIELLSVPDGCELSQDGQVSCLLGRMRAGESREISLSARVRRDVECRDGEQFTFISNTAEVENLAGGDPNRQNDRSTVRIRVMCVNFEYPAKLVCGKQSDPNVLRLMRGLYGTTVNIHNPNDEETYLFKKLALAFPPVEQKPGKIIPIAVDHLAYDESLKTDCDELLRNHFPNGFPEGYVEGHIVVQSALSLDVQSVFTAAPLDREGYSGGVSSIDVEYVPERKVERESGEKPDLIVEENSDVSVDCQTFGENPNCAFSVSFQISNIGDAPSGLFDAEITFGEDALVVVKPVDEMIPAGETVSISAGGVIPLDTGFPGITQICIRADAPQNQVDEILEDNNERCFES